MGRKYIDNALTTLASSITNLSTTLPVAAATGSRFPAITGRGPAGAALDHFVITMEDSSGNREKIKVEERSGDILGSAGYPLIRGYDGTIARSWNAGDAVDLRLERAAAQDHEDKIAASAIGRAFGYKDSTTSGLIFGYYGALLPSTGGVITVADGTVALTDNATNYVEATTAGAVSTNTAGFTAGRIQIAQVSTVSGKITAITDKRAALLANDVAVARETLGVPNKNAIIGGDFALNAWVRGTSFASILSGMYNADRWVYAKTGAMVHDLSKAADAPTVAQAGVFTNACMLIDCTTVDSSIAAGDFTLIEQRIEGFNFRTIAQRAFTLSFWHKHTKAGTYCVSFRNSGDDRSYVAEYTQAVSDTWQKTTITVPASPSAGTWNYDSGVGLRVSFALAAGSTFHTTAGAWQTGSYFSTSNQVNACDSTINNFKIALVQIEPGSAATEFEQITTQEYSARADRYYRLVGQGASGVIQDSTVVSFAGALTPTMRTSPTATVYDTTITIRYPGANDLTSAGSTIQYSSLTPYGWHAGMTGFSGLTAGHAGVERFGDPFLALSAEL